MVLSMAGYCFDRSILLLLWKCEKGIEMTREELINRLQGLEWAGYDMLIRSERDYVWGTLGLQIGVEKRVVVENVVEMGKDVVEDVVETGRNVVENLTDRQYRIVDLIREDNTIPAIQLALKLSVASRTVQRELTKLKQMGILERIGSDKGGYWKVLK